MTDQSWDSAPKIVKNWAYLMTWLSIILLPVGLLTRLFSRDISAASRIGGAAFILALLALYVWLNRGLKKGARAAWSVQILMSILGLFMFPLGTIIHGYILLKWFKPETKAWFGA